MNGDVGVYAVIMEKHALGGGCRILRGRFSIPLNARVIRPCARAVEVCDNRRASARGRSAPSGSFDCADRASSTRDRGCASCRTALRRRCDSCHLHCARRAHGSRRSSVRDAVWIVDERQDLARVHSSYATADGLRTHALPDRRRTVVRQRKRRRPPAALWTRYDVPPRPCAALHASRQARGAPGRLQDRAVADALTCEEQPRRLPRPE